MTATRVVSIVRKTLNNAFPYNVSAFPASRPRAAPFRRVAVFDPVPRLVCDLQRELRPWKDDL
jgi:hypothetical protein